MSLPARDRTLRAIGYLHTQWQRIVEASEACKLGDPGDYPRQLGMLRAEIEGRAQLIAHLIDAAQEAAAECWNPCTHEHGCLDCEAAAERDREDRP